MNFLGRYNLILYSLFISLLFICYKGYQFNAWDQAECLPQVYQLHDTSLYPTDFFMQEYNSVFTIRDYFVRFVHSLSLVIPLAALSFMLCLLTIIIDVYLVIRITSKFTESKLAPLLSPIPVFFLFHGFVVGGNSLQDTMLIPGMLTMPFSLAGIWFFINQRYKLSFFLLGLGTLFQPLAALQVFGVLWVILLLDSNTRSFKIVAPPTLLYLLPASFILAPIFYRQFGLQVSYDKELYYTVLYRFRNHLHYLPSLFPVMDYVKLGSLVALGFVATRMADINQRAFIYRFSTLVIIGMIAYWFGLEVLNIYAVGKMQWFKNSMWLNMFSSITLSILLAKWLEKMFGNFEWKKWHAPTTLLSSAVLLLLLMNTKYIPIEKVQTRYQIGNYQKSDLTILHEWIAKNLPKDAVVLCSPQNTSFSCEAKRNQVIQYQAVIHEPFYMLPWYQRFKEVYGVDIDNVYMKDVRQQAAEAYEQQNYKGNKYHIDYRIDNVKKCRFVDQLGPIVYQSGDYTLTKFIAE